MDLTFIFSEIYDFCKELESRMVSDEMIKKCLKEKRLHVSEILTITVNFSFSGYKNFKVYYVDHVTKHLRNEFPNLSSYTRFIELKQEVVGIAALLAIQKNSIKQSDIHFADSFPLEVCHIRRSSAHKTCKQIARKGRTSMGFFYGLKLHAIIDPKGNLEAFALTPGNVADNNKNLLSVLTKNIFGKLFGDKGYLLRSKTYEEFFKKKLKFITKVRSNMKKPLYELYDKIMLKKRGLIESVGNVLKNVLGIEHSRHRSINAFFLHVFSCLIAYAFKPSKPSILQDFPVIP